MIIESQYYDIAVFLDITTERLENLEKDLIMRIGKLETDKIRKDQKIAALESDQKVKGERIANLEADKKAKDERVANLEADMKAKEERIENLEADKKANGERIENLEADKKANEERIENLEADKKANEERIENLEADKKANEERIQNLKADMEAKDVRITTLEADKKPKEQRISNLEADKRTKDQRVANLEAEDKELQERIKDVENPPFGYFCGSQDSFSAANSVITYDKLLYSSKSGLQGDSPGIDIKTGKFVSGFSGTWRVDFSLRTVPDPGEKVDIYLYKNGEKITETLFRSVRTSESSGYDTNTGGRSVLLHLDLGDEVHLATTNMEDTGIDIIFCVSLEQPSRHQSVAVGASVGFAGFGFSASVSVE